MIRRTSVDEALDLFGSAGAREELSIAHGCVALVVEGAAWPGAPVPDLPCVLVGCSPGGGWDDFDVAGSDEGELAPVLGGVEAHPQASLALVQLLRARLSEVDVALWAESVTYGLLQGGAEFGAWREAHPPSPVGEAAGGAPLRVERDGDRVEVVLDRPTVHNALDVRLRDALVEALAALAADDTVREIALRGDGPSFSSGGDLHEFGTFPDPATAHVVRSTRLPARAVAGVRDRLRAEVHGACVGAGVELAAFARTVVATPDTTLRLPEVGMGLIPGSGGTWSVPTRVGRHRAAWMALGGSSIEAETALDWGLVDEIIE